MLKKSSFILMLALLAAGCTHEVYLQPVPCDDCQPCGDCKEPEVVQEVYEVVKPAPVCPCYTPCYTCTVPTCTTYTYTVPTCTTCQPTYTYTYTPKVQVVETKPVVEVYTPKPVVETYKPRPVTEQIIQETRAPEAMPVIKRK